MRDWCRVAIICGGQARTLPSQLQPVMPANERAAAAITLFRVTISQEPCPAKVAELADAPDLGSGGETHGGSSPPFRTNSPRLDRAFTFLITATPFPYSLLSSNVSIDLHT